VTSDDNMSAIDLSKKPDPISTASDDIDGERLRVATVELTVGGRKVRLELNVPKGPTPPIALLPIFQTIADTLVGIAVENAQATGLTVSCKKGCGACCRQLVPISEIEVESLRKLVDELPEPRRQEIVDRFERATRQLHDASLLQALRASDRVTRENIHALGAAYFAQGLPCPFLEDESCSIHSKRPLACREYLVTSPATHCTHPSAQSIRCVTMPAKVSRAVRHLDTGKANRSATWIPMILALEWPRGEQNRAEAPTGTASIVTFFEQLTGKQIPETGQSVNA